MPPIPSPLPQPPSFYVSPNTLPWSGIRFHSEMYWSGTSNSRSRGALALKLGWWVGLTCLILPPTYGVRSAGVAPKHPESCHFAWFELILCRGHFTTPGKAR
jgi:hypothetical protein